MNKNSTIIFTLNEFAISFRSQVFDPEVLFDEVNVDADLLQTILKRSEVDVNDDIVKKLYDFACKV